MQGLRLIRSNCNAAVSIVGHPSSKRSTSCKSYSGEPNQMDRPATVTQYTGTRLRSFCCPVVVWLEKPVPNSETHQFLSANAVEPKRMTSLCDRPLPIYTPDEWLPLFHTGSSCNSMPISSNSCRAGITSMTALHNSCNII